MLKGLIKTDCFDYAVHPPTRFLIAVLAVEFQVERPSLGCLQAQADDASLPGCSGELKCRERPPVSPERCLDLHGLLLYKGNRAWSFTCAGYGWIIEYE